MLRSMSWAQLQEWMAFDEISPLPDRRGDWQAASIIAGLSNSLMAARGIKTSFKPSMFLLEFKDPEDATAKVQEAPAKAVVAAPAGRSWQEMKMFARMHVAAANVKPGTRGRRK